MPARYFTDSSAIRWEVFEVRRHSSRADAVSAGLESGWLTFISGTAKRRLPAYPESWWSLSDGELESLLASARVPSAVARSAAADSPPPAGARATAPRVAPAIGPAALATSVVADAPVVMGGAGAQRGVSLADDEIRTLARHSRAAGLTAVQAMLRLKRVLEDNAIDRAAPGHKSARRLFVETFYFDAPAP